MGGGSVMVTYVSVFSYQSAVNISVCRAENMVTCWETVSKCKPEVAEMFTFQLCT